MTRWLIGVLALLHGFAHLVGAAGSWDLLPHEQRAYRTTILGGRIDLGPRGMQIWGLLWGLTSLAFVAVAIAGFLSTPWWVTAASAVAGISLILTLTELPDARVGTLVNVALLGLLLMGQHFAWF
jgi:hypothetical protein